MPAQSGDAWCVLQHFYKPVQNTNRALKGFPSRGRGTDLVTHLCCTLMEEQCLSLSPAVWGKRETFCLDGEMKRNCCCCCWVTDPKVWRKIIELWNNLCRKTILRCLSPTVNGSWESDSPASFWIMVLSPLVYVIFNSAWGTAEIFSWRIHEAGW